MPKSHLFQKNLHKRTKSDVRESTLKKHENSMRNRWEEVMFQEAKMTLKYCSVVQKQGFDSLRKYENNGHDRDAKSHPKSSKIAALGDLGMIF